MFGDRCRDGRCGGHGRQKEVRKFWLDRKKCGSCVFSSAQITLPYLALPCRVPSNMGMGDVHLITAGLGGGWEGGIVQ